MDYEKILDDLERRAESTNFEAEREACLRKIEIFKQKVPKFSSFVHNFSSSNSFEDEEENVNMVLLRNLFVDIYFPYFKEGFAISENNVPVNIDYYFTESLQRRMDESIRNFPNNKKLYKFYSQVMSWAKEQYSISKQLTASRINLQNFYFVFVDLETAYFFHYNTEGLEKHFVYRKEFFEHEKSRFFERLHEGYFDKDIKDLLNPSLLEFQD